MRPYLSPTRTIGECARFIGGQEDHISESRVTVTGITSNSRALESGDLFVALPGAQRHGIEFLSDAVRAGCKGILTDDKGLELMGDKLAHRSSQDFPVLRTSLPRAVLGPLTSWFYDNPSSSMKTFGVTGTNGKTTSTTLLHQLLQRSGVETGLIGTISNQIGNESIPAIHTTPEADDLQSLLATMKERHCGAVAMEVSSHGLQLHRVAGTTFTACAFTNLSQDHLDFHGTMENYYQAKRSLFTSQYTQRAYIMIDDDYGRRLRDEVSLPTITLSLHDRKAHWHYESYNATSRGYEIALRGEQGILLQGLIPLFGEYNLQNALIAIALAFEAGVDALEIERQLPALLPATGRLERVDMGQEFLALIDYAHSPDAVSRALKAARTLTTGKVIGVLGCGGDRDASKRSLMGKELLAGCDLAIFTSDNPRSEDPAKIIKEMTAGLSVDHPHQIIIDRREAIEAAVEVAASGDLLIVLGKGHETGQEINGIKLPFSDRDVLAEAMRA